MSDWYEIFERGRQIACQAHGEQRYGDKPYKNHLADVVAVLRRFDLSLDDNETAPILVAAWLHDSLEDTALDRDFLTREFGSDIAELVWLVTDEPGLSRKERKPAFAFHPNNLFAFALLAQTFSTSPCRRSPIK